jgi:hypothetical protein
VNTTESPASAGLFIFVVYPGAALTEYISRLHKQARVSLQLKEKALAIDPAELDAMQARYKSAVEAWINAIREEEALATPAEHSETDIDNWEAAGENEEAARDKAKSAKADYEAALRKEFFNF